MAINYQKRLKNIQNRRFDKELNESILSKSFSSSSIPQSVKYLMESMKEIDSKYNDRTIEAAESVKEHLEDNLNLNFDCVYRTQGSVMTSTNIKNYSDIDLLTIIDEYYYFEKSLESNNLYTDPDLDIITLRDQSEKIMDNIYDDEVDKTGTKSITIFDKSLKRKVDIIFCFWFNKRYEESRDEFYRGIYLFDFCNKEKIKDYPFAHIDEVNSKGDLTNDGSRKCIRLLKSLKEDADEEINLSSFHLTSIVHSIENSQIDHRTVDELQLAIETSNEIDNLISCSSYRKSIKSPNGRENPLIEENIVPELKKLKKDLDSLILDVP